MKKTALILVAFLCALKLTAQEVPAVADSSFNAKLDSMLTVYVKAIESLDVEQKTKESDFLIQSSADNSLRTHIANFLFNYYKESPLMGEEAVALYIYDKWFKSKLIPIEGEFSAMSAELFAEFNRRTMIGDQAPVITLSKKNGRKIVMPSKGKSCVLFFYEAGCDNCKVQKDLLPTVMKGVDFPVDFYAVYTGSEKDKWKEFRRSFKIRNRKVKLIHVWDPEVESDYVRLYGIVSTPKIYFIEPGGSVIGRRLDALSLQALLPVAADIDRFASQLKDK